MNVQASDLGWFYHAPPRPKHEERVIPPPPSQIPGLSDVSHIPEPAPAQLWLKESDSKYVRLAKMGGRQNLLCYNAPDTASSEPVGYPRCEWYYDNIQQPQPADDCEKEPYQFMLPDYMVFNPNRQKTSKGTMGDIVRGPHCHDSSTIFEREGSMATDKTVKLPEERSSGYGVRTEKKKQQQQQLMKRGACTNAYACNPQPLSANFSKSIEKEGVDMKKIMSYSYASDYDAQRKQYEAQSCQQQQPQQQQQETTGGGPNKMSPANKCGSRVKRKC